MLCQIANYSITQLHHALAYMLNLLIHVNTQLLLYVVYQIRDMGHFKYPIIQMLCF